LPNVAGPDPSAAPGPHRTSSALDQHEETDEGLGSVQTSSDEFRRLWELELVETQRHRTKSVHHPVVGPLELFCDVLTIPDRDQHLVLLTAEPGSPTEQALRLLAVIGIQSMDVHPKGHLLKEPQEQSSPTRST
jgi:hypothetical protein